MRYDFASFNISSFRFGAPPKGDVTFSYAAGNVQEFIYASTQWQSFVHKSLDTPFPLNYVYIELNSTGLIAGGNGLLFSSGVICSDISATNAIVQALRVGDIAKDISCGNNIWRVRNGTLIVSSAEIIPYVSFESSCYLPSQSNILLLPSVECLVKNPIKMASMVRIKQVSITKSTVPKIVNPISINPARDRFYVNVTVVGGAKGVIYCASFKSGFSLTSVNNVKIMNYRSIINLGKKNVTNIVVRVVVAGLTPVTAYDTYCYAEDLLGNGDVLSTVFNTKLSQSTLCCKSVSFLNAPPSVYGNSTKYLSSSSSTIESLSTQTYTFIYQLDSAPSQGIIVQHNVYASNGDGTVVVVPMPKSRSYNNASSSGGLTGTFILSGSAGSYIVKLQIVGQSADEFTGASTDVVVLSDSEPLHAPTMLSVEFGTAGNIAVVSFDSPTNQGGIFINYWSCDLIFSFNGANGSTCTWTSTSTVTITFDYRDGLRLLEPGDRVDIMTGVLRAYCFQGKDACIESEPSRAMSTIAGFPVNAITPTVVLSYPAVLGPCVNLSIDATASTGNCGRSWKSVIWSVNASNGITPELQSLIERYNDTSSPLMIPQQYIPPGIYSFSLHLENFLGKSSVASAVVKVISSDYYIPTVTIIGSPFRTISRSDEFSIQMLGTVPACATDKNLTYSWRIYNNYVFVNIPSTSKDFRKLKIDPYTLSAGETYQILGFATSAYGQSSYAIATVYVSVGSIYAVIDGGYSRLVSTYSDVVLDASPSVDADEIVSGINNLGYSWKCFVLSIEKYGSSCNVPLPSVPVLTISGGILEPSLTYEFTLTVFSSANADRSSSAVVVLQVASVPPIRANINVQYFEFNPSDKLKLNASIAGNESVFARWTVTGPTNIDLDSEMVSLTSTYRNFSSSELNMSIPYPLVVNSNVFAAGCSYTFTLSVYLFGSYKEEIIVSYKQITLTANGPPTSGYIAVTPANGSALHTQFLLAAVQWTDAITDYPLTFQHLYKVSESASVMSLGTLSEKSYVNAILPAGVYTEAYVVTCFVNVSDAHGSSTWSSATVTVLPHSGAQASAAVTVQQTLAVAFDSGDIDTAILTVNTIASTLNYVNCSGAMNCTKLHREDCSTVSQSCGSCIPGYVGIPGASNSRCTAAGNYIPLGHPCNSQTADLCYYGYCLNGICSTPLKSCPTADPSLVCSGHGNCTFIDSLTKVRRLKCSVADSDCEAQCQCVNGYGGRDCGYDPQELSTRSEARNVMCSSIVIILGLQDNSSNLLVTLANSFVASFSPYETSTDSLECSQALQAVAQLAATGVLSIGSGAEAALAEGISSYLVVNGQNNSANVTRSNHLTSSADLLIQGLHRDMEGGQSPVFVESSYLRVSARYESLSELANQTFQATSSNSVQSRITLPSIGMDMCGFSGGYAKFALMQWNKSPFSPELALKGNPLSMAVSKSPTDNTGSNKVYDEELQTYQLLLQYNTPQDWSIKKPDCTLIRDNVNIPCPCNVSSYSAYNVSLKCYNFAELCSQMIGTHRELLNFPSSNGNNFAQSTPSDTFGALATSSGQVIANTITTTPNFSNINQDLTALGMVCGIVAFMVLGFFFFKGWDGRDHHVLIYIKNANLNKKLTRKMEGNIDLADVSEIKGTGTGTGMNSLSDLSHRKPSKKTTVSNLSDNLLANFFENLLRSGSIFRKENFGRAFSKVILQNHVWIRMWTYSSLRSTRSNRFLSLCNNVLMIMFVNTIFYGVFFPSTCKGYSKSEGGSNTTCLSSTSSWSHNTTCVWNADDGTCSINPPPASMMFYAEVAILVSLFSLIPAAILDFVMSEYCSRRPILESIGLQSRDWLGRPSDPSENGMKVARKSELGQVYESSPRAIDPISTPTTSSEASQLKSHVLAKDDVKYVYCSALSVTEELRVILEDANVFLQECATNPPVPWRGIAVNSELEARKEAIMSQLGIYPDGTLVPLTFFQKLYYGSAEKKLLWRLKKVRQMEREILSTMETLAEGEEDMRDRCLIQYFVLEQLTSLKRYAVS